MRMHGRVNRENHRQLNFIWGVAGGEGVLWVLGGVNVFMRVSD